MNCLAYLCQGQLAQQGFDQARHFITGVRERIIKGEKIPEYHQLQYGAKLYQSLPWTVNTLVTALLRKISASWRRSIHLEVFRQFKKKVSQGPLPAPLHAYDLIRIRRLFPNTCEAIRQNWSRHLVEQRISPQQLVKMAYNSPPIATAITELRSSYSLWPEVEQETVKNQFRKLGELYRKDKGVQLVPECAEKPPPLSFTAQQLQSEIDLMNLWKQVKPIIKQKIEQPEQLEDVYNIVYPIWDETKTPIAYYKESYDTSSACAIMERLVWDLSVVMDVPDQFAPTKILPVLTNHKGSFQRALQGQVLGDWIDANSEASPPTTYVIQSMVTALVFGFYDAHVNNIYNTETSKGLVFFDNTRCLPHSNNVICYHKILLPSVRIGLLELDVCYEPLTEEEQEFLQKEIEKYREALPKAIAFLDHPITRRKASGLPENWLNIDEAIDALEERMQRLCAARVETLRDLVFAVHPDFRFLAAMSLTGDALTTPDQYLVDWWNQVKSNSENGPKLYKLMQKMFLANIGGQEHDIKKMILNNGRIDPKLVKKWCDDPSLSFEQILEKMSLNLNVDIPFFCKKISKSGWDIYINLLDQSAFDCKDFY